MRRRDRIPRVRPRDEPAADVRTHGAGPGGRIAAIALVALVVILGALVLYWGISQ